MFIAALFTIVKIWKQPKCTSTGERIKKMWYMYISQRNTTQHKKNENLPFAAAWMDLQGIMLSEISQTEKDKYCMTSCVEYENTTVNI